MELISIVVPFYRIEKKVIKYCVDSIINQTYKKIEAFLVDDGNTDGSSEYLDELAKDYSFISVIHQKNSGVSAARNAGIYAAQGEYIVFLDGDDCLSSDYIESFVQAIEKTHADIIYAEHVVFKDKCVFESSPCNNPVLIENKTIVMRSVLSSGVSKEIGLHGAPWGKAFKTSLLKDNKLLFDTKLPRSQDNEFNFRVLQYADKVAYLPDKLYGYRESEQSAMTRYRSDSKEIQERYLDKVVEDAHYFDVLDIVKHDIDVITMIKFFDICNTCILHKDNSDSIRDKIAIIKKTLNEDRYKKALNRVTTKDFDGAPKLYIFLLKRELVTLYCITHGIRRILKGL